MSDNYLYLKKEGSFYGTPITLSSVSPVSFILIIPRTLIGTTVKGLILALEISKTSRGSLSYPIVFGTNP